MTSGQASIQNNRESITIDQCNREGVTGTGGYRHMTNKTTNKTQLPELFKLDGKIITDKNNLANKFNTFFTNIGPSLASTITTAGNKTYKSFLNEPSTNEFTFNQITEVDVLNIIDKLPSKASSGVDGLSPILLKHIKNEISRPVTLI